MTLCVGRRAQRGVLNYLIGPIKLIRTVKKTHRGLVVGRTAGGLRGMFVNGWVGSAAVVATTVVTGTGGMVGKGAYYSEQLQTLRLDGFMRCAAAAVVCSARPSCLFCASVRSTPHVRHPSPYTRPRPENPTKSPYSSHAHARRRRDTK